MLVCSVVILVETPIKVIPKKFVEAASYSLFLYHILTSTNKKAIKEHVRGL